MNSLFLKKLSQDQLREILLFLIKLSIVYLLWWLFIRLIGYQSQPIEDRYWPWLSIHWEKLNDGLRIVLLNSGKVILQVLGYDARIYGEYILYVHNHYGVGVGNYCLGFQLMVLYVALVVSIRSSWKLKLMAVPLGLLVIQGLNLLRIVGIALVVVYYPAYVNYSHDYVFNFIVLGVIILMYTKILSKAK